MLTKEAPFKSEAQRRFLWAKHPSIAKRWAHEFPGQHDLPEHVKKSALYHLARERISRIIKSAEAPGEMRRGAPTIVDEENSWPFLDIRKKLEGDRDEFRDTNLDKREQVRKRMMDRIMWYLQARQRKNQDVAHESNREVPVTEERAPHSFPDGTA